MMRARDVMDADPVTVSALATRRDLVETFRAHRAPSLAVVKGDARKLVGVVSTHHLLESDRYAFVSQMMDPNPATTYPQAALAETAPLFPRARATLLPVINASNDVLGVLRPAHVLPYLRPPRSRLATLLLRRLVPVHETTPGPVAAEILRTTRARVLVVLDDASRLAGVVHPLDLLDPDGHPLPGPVRQRMDPHPLVLEPSTNVNEAIDRVLHDPHAALVLVDAEARLHDVFTDVDLLELALQRQAPEASFER